MDNLDVILRLIVAGGLGGLIGLERDVHGRAAGLRTHLLVCMGAALFMIMSIVVAKMWGPEFVSDPGRIAAQIVTGIGFLGAGAILKEGFSVRGLTTASSLWIVAAVGMASGAGCYGIAGVTAVLALISLSVLRRIERHYRKDFYRMLTVTTSADADISRIVETVEGGDIKILFVDFDRNYEEKTTTCSISVRLFHQGLTDKLSQGIVKALEEAGIPLKEVKWGHHEGS
jgi:putative Mg2+ transporter-C (MgtC) family protein